LTDTVVPEGGYAVMDLTRGSLIRNSILTIAAS